MLVREYQYEVLWSIQQRKHKTWKDGKLKYNAFNKKVLLFDESSNVIVSGWAAKPPEEGADLEIENAHVQVGSLLSHKQSEHHARKVPIYVPEVSKRQLPISSISLDEIILLSKTRKRIPAPSESELSLESTPMPALSLQDSDRDFETPDTSLDMLLSEDEVEILKVAPAPDPPKGGPIHFPDGLATEGPWTKEAYLLMSWHPPIVKEET